MPDPFVVAAWEAEFRNHRYLDDPPLAFVQEIITAARTHGLGTARGLYIGCGNGRNYLPLVAQGLDLLGLDVSPTALAQLSAKAPERASRLVCGDLAALPARARYPIVIAIQVLQHGNEATTHLAVERALRRVVPGGLFCVRVNAVGTQPEHRHVVCERGEDGRFTVRYLEGPKRGLVVHFFSGPELEALVGPRWTPCIDLRPVVTRRPPPASGVWVQWEGIWRKPPKPAAAVGGPTRANSRSRLASNRPPRGPSEEATG
jgi:SAM-dependent methyltransferase